jgi:hypothetical protein
MHTRRAATEDDVDIEFFLAGWGVGFTVYSVLQLLAVVTLQHRRRVIVLLPAPVMLGVLVWTVFAYRNGSNLWPIIMIFASPLSVVGLIVLWISLRFAQKREAVSRTDQMCG